MNAFKPKVLFRGFLIFCLLILSISILLSLPLRWFNPPTTAFILADKNIDSLNLHSKWVKYDSVSPQLFLAVIAAEDQKFPEHFGFDFKSLKKALSERRSKRRGASTITQQLVKNLYLWPGRSFLRKGVEAWLTIWLEFFLSKERILELYVNVVEFGPGIYGVGSASQNFFNLSPKNINALYASLLAAVLPSPKRYSAQHPSTYIYDRAHDIRASMRALGGIGYLRQL